MKHTLFTAVSLLGLAFFSAGCKTNSKEAETVSPTVKPSDPNSIAADNSGSASPYPSQSGAAQAPAQSSGMKKTYSGLQYQVIREGTGRRPSQYQRVKVHYHGTLPNGTVFDSSVQRGQPASFGLNQVIAGWTEGIPLMREGAKYRFIIPPHLAYGARGMPPKIGPNQTLIFDVELIQVL
ncbi:MAG: FKBP-type peptidyl-prolyl cis-trans isomerase [Verrucomicrobiales bacterium]|nr:FKBP-type peptidyl-prolyl cis-trans isomerase [Verrucomicrobiales bacterium]